MAGGSTTGWPCLVLVPRLLLLLHNRDKELDQRRLFDGSRMPDDADFDGASGIANEADVIDVASGAHEWRRDREECIARAHGVNDGAGEGGNACRRAAALVERDAAGFAVGN